MSFCDNFCAERSRPGAAGAAGATRSGPGPARAGAFSGAGTIKYKKSLRLAITSFKDFTTLCYSVILLCCPAGISQLYKAAVQRFLLS